MVEYYNNILTIEAGWLISNNVFSESNYLKLQQREKIQVLRRACYGTPALVAYDSMPDRFKRKVVEILKKNPYEIVKIKQLQIEIEHSAEASEFFEDYKLADGRKLPTKTRHEYYINAIVFDAIDKMISSKKGFRSSLGGKATRKWEQISEGVQELDRKIYPHTLPANDRRLEAKFKKYKKEGYESLIHKNFLNINARKVINVRESLMRELLADPRNLDDTQIMRLYNIVAEEMRWSKITRNTVAQWREKLEPIIYAGRHGSSAFRNNKSMQVKRSAPTAPLYFWTMDGWDAELLYQGENQKGTTVYHLRPTIVVILDAFMNYPIGYAIGTHETPELIKEALRNAERHTIELFGEMYRPHQIQSDNYSIKKMMPYYTALADKVTPARVRNAKSKVIERWFGTFNKEYCQMQMNWSGFGITSNKNKQPNVEFLNKYKKNFPDFEGVCRQLANGIEWKREQLKAEFVEKFNLKSTKKIEMPKDRYLLHFGETTGNKIMMRGAGLLPTIKGQKRAYDCFDMSFRKHSSTRWQVMYDPNDMSEVLAINEDGSLQYVLEEKYVQPMALIDRKEGDAEELEKVQRFNKQLEEHITEQRAISGNETRQLFENNPHLLQHETLKKLMIVDSEGQHKNNKYLSAPALRSTKKKQKVEIQDAEIVENELSMYDMY